MKTPVTVLLLLLAALSALGQVQAPQVPMTGNIGAGGTFPIFNFGTISMTSDADYTMVTTGYAMTAVTLKITSTVALTATRNVIHPSVGQGFLVNVENLTTGGQSITFKGPTGTGVTIANGRTVTVMSDGTNYVRVGVDSSKHNSFGGVTPIDAYPTWPNSVNEDGSLTGANNPAIFSVSEQPNLPWSSNLIQHTGILSMPNYISKTTGGGDGTAVWGDASVDATSTAAMSIWGVSGTADDYSNAGSTITNQYVEGLYGAAYHNGSTTNTYLMGVDANAVQGGSGTVQNLIGVSGIVGQNAGSGNVLKAYGANLGANISATTNTLYGVWTGGGLSGAGNVGTYYANYVQQLQVGSGSTLSKAYAFVSEPGAGSVGINTTSPTADLEVIGTGRFTNVTVTGTCTGCGAWPAGGAGIPNYSGSSSWGTSYSAANKIPFNFLATTVPLAASCAANQYQTASSNTGSTCSQVQYSQIGGALTANTTGTAAGITGNGSTGQVWGMIGSSVQGWVTGATPTYPQTVAGAVNSGGIPYASSTTQQSYSATLGSSQVVLGGGLGAAPTTTPELGYTGGILNVGTTGGNTGALQLNGATSGNFTMTPSATANTITLGGTGYTSLITPAGSLTAVAIGTSANTGLYFPSGGSTMTWSNGGAIAWQLGGGAMRCNANPCIWSATGPQSAQTFEGGLDTPAGFTTGAAIFKSAGITGGTASSGTGSATIQTGDNAATGGASQSVGNLIITSGGFTGASGATAAWSPGYVIVQQKYWADSAVQPGALACFTTPGAAGQMPKVGTCTATGTSIPWIGIISGTQGQAVGVVKSGHAAGVLSNASVTDAAGYFVCIDSANAGKVIVQATVCTAGQGVGIIDQTSAAGTSHSVDVERF